MTSQVFQDQNTNTKQVKQNEQNQQEQIYHELPQTELHTDGIGSGDSSRNIIR